MKQQVKPIALREKDAGEAFGFSGDQLRKRRKLDEALMRMGKAPEGPRWFLLNKTVVYYLADIEKWLRANTVERGVPKFRGKRYVPPRAEEGQP